MTNALTADKKYYEIPKVYKQYSNKMILVVEFIHGVSIRDSSLLLKQHGIKEK